MLSSNNRQQISGLVVRTQSKPTTIVMACLIGLPIGAYTIFPGTVNAQQNEKISEPEAAAGLPIPQPFRQATYGSQPFLLHLPTGFARAIILPEAVTLKSTAEQLPGAAIEIEGRVIGFFATQTFDRRPILFEGVQTGLIYEFQIRASEQGIREPLQINR